MRTSSCHEQLNRVGTLQVLNALDDLGGQRERSDPVDLLAVDAERLARGGDE
ncbi:MAG TPA: hypothetical protein VK217_03525 [Acidimicrobiales bacterium]|nr:hypothetical protein [Acidimicrobiales bacterium]